MRYEIVEQQDVSGRAVLVVGRVHPKTRVLQDQQLVTEPVLRAVARFVEKYSDGCLDRSILSAADETRLELVVRAERVPVSLEEEVQEMSWGEIRDLHTELDRQKKDDPEAAARFEIVSAEYIQQLRARLPRRQWKG